MGVDVCGCVLDVCLFAFVCSCDPEHTLKTDFSSILMLCDPFENIAIELSNFSTLNSTILPFFHSLILPTLSLNVAPYTHVASLFRRNERRGTNFSTRPSAKTAAKAAQTHSTTVVATTVATTVATVVATVVGGILGMRCV
jgi:hypothetical protein